MWKSWKTWKKWIFQISIEKKHGNTKEQRWFSLSIAWKIWKMWKSWKKWIFQISIEKKPWKY